MPVLWKVMHGIHVPASGRGSDAASIFGSPLSVLRSLISGARIIAKFILLEILLYGGLRVSPSQFIL